jgi:hypothetical protein
MSSDEPRRGKEEDARRRTARGLYRLMFFGGGGGLTDRDPRLLKLASSGGATVFRCKPFVNRRELLELSCSVGLDGRNAR